MNRIGTCDVAPNKRRLAIFVATSGHSGVDRIVKNIVPAFVEKGCLVDLLHVQGHGPRLVHVPEGVRIVELGHPHVYSCLYALIQYLKRERPTAMLSDKDRVNRVALLAKKFSRASTRIVVRTGTTVSKDLEGRGRLERWMHYFSMHYMYNWADAIIVPSYGAAVDLAEFAEIPLERVSAVPSPVVTPNLMEKATHQTTHPWFDSKEFPVIAGVGELCARKDFYTLIKAFAKVRRKRPCKLAILGKGRHKAALQELVQELGITQDAALLGFVDNPYSYMSKSDVFVHSALYEGAPVALMEALALGTPVVATDCPSGPREILQSDRYGRLVPVGDVNAMADAIDRTLDAPPDRSFLKEAVAPFTVTASAGRYLEVLGMESEMGNPERGFRKCAE